MNWIKRLFSKPPEVVKGKYDGWEILRIGDRFYPTREGAFIAPPAVHGASKKEAIDLIDEFNRLKEESRVIIKIE